jgi:hypothetical protein
MRIELSDLSGKPDELRIMHAMGRETANIHLGTKDASENVSRDLRSRPSDWLHQAAKDMAKAVIGDWEEWRNQ